MVVVVAVSTGVVVCTEVEVVGEGVVVGGAVVEQSKVAFQTSAKRRRRIVVRGLSSFSWKNNRYGIVPPDCRNPAVSLKMAPPTI